MNIYKKLILTGFGLFLACSTSGAQEVFYASAVKSLQLNPESTKIDGRLLPTNKIEILSKEGDKIKIRITGYQNPATPSVVYFTDSHRIIVAAFSKSTKLDTKVEEEGKDGKWNKVSFEAYTTDDDLKPDLQPLYEEANALYTENCSMCHGLHKVSEYKANQWPSTFNSMTSRTPIAKESIQLVIQYLQKHASDIKQ